MYKNRNLYSSIDKILSNLKKKDILTKDEVRELIGKKSDEIVLPISIFNRRLNLVEASSRYMKDRLGLSFRDIAGFLKKNSRSVERSYNNAKSKMKE